MLTPRYAGWPDAAVALVERGVARHGGWDRWTDLRRVSFRPMNLAGALPWAKGNGRTFSLPPAVDTFPHDRRTVFHDYPGPGSIGVFDRGDVRIDGPEPAASADHRTLVPRLRRWRPIDALYFFGYALWHYHSLPFTLGDAAFVRLRGSALTVDFPPDVPTHSRRQTFHFDGDGRVRRHDYTADVVGAFARGAHFWDEPAHVGGFVFAGRRVVLPRILGGTLPIPVLTAEVRDFTIG